MGKMNRRAFLRAMGAGCAALTFSRGARALSPPRKRPNIVMILTDDQDKMSLGAYGGKSLTPNLDRMAAEGVVFDHAYVSSTVCTPSRYSFLTGRYAGRSYSERYEAQCPRGQQGFPSFNMELEPDNMNVGAVLAGSGYATGYVGKYHVGPEIKRQNECEAHGLKYVDREAAPEEATAAYRYNELQYRKFLRQRGFTWAKHIYWENVKSPFAYHNADWTVEAALEFIEEHRDEPFYLHYCTTLTHGPDKSWSTSMQHPRVSGQGLLDEPATPMATRDELLKEIKDAGLDPEAGHAGYRWVDESVGAILGKLKELGIDDNTLVVFASDHGSNMKGSLFSLDGVCIPCIMRWPKVIPEGVRCDELIQNIDFAATFFDVAGADVPKRYAMDGRSLMPLLSDQEGDPWRDHLYFEAGSARAVCTKQWKYIAVRYTAEQIEQIKKAPPESLPRLMAYIGRMGIGTRGASHPGFFDADQLYDTRRDPREMKNVAGDPKNAGRLRVMQAMLRKDVERLGRPFGEFAPGGNAARPGQVDEQIALVKRMKIQGKDVIVPKDAASQEPATKPDKRTERERRREERRRKR
jgi:arylsulfatase A-like enzyme